MISYVGGRRYVGLQIIGSAVVCPHTDHVVIIQAVCYKFCSVLFSSLFNILFCSVAHQVQKVSRRGWHRTYVGAMDPGLFDDSEDDLFDDTVDGVAVRWDPKFPM